jgi:peptidoglycan/xylan/chitin deacetylase (PgdA/CDA1 family)
MKLSVFLLILIATGPWSFSQTKLEYTIAPWQGNKKAAVSVSFDDCMPSQFENAIPVLNAANRKIPATFFLTAKSIAKNAQSIINAHKNKHEIANHSTTHPSFRELSPTGIEAELLNCQDTIRNLFNGQVSFTMAYPNGNGGDSTPQDSLIRTIVSKYFIGARATQIKPSAINEYIWAKPFVDDSYYLVNSPMIADGYTRKKFGKDLQKAIAKGGWYAPTYHGVGGGWIITSTDLFTSHMDELQKRKDQLWIATFKDVIAYHRERNCSRLNVISESDERLHLELTDTLKNDAIFNMPLTIRMKKTAGWAVRSISQSNTALKYRLENKTIQFDAIPDGGPIIIRKKTI